MAGVGGTKLDKDFQKVFLRAFVNFVERSDNLPYLIGLSSEKALHFTTHHSSAKTPAFSQPLCRPRRPIPD